MGLGRLLDYPFDATVWGTVAAWVGALGTSSAFLLAANVYRLDRKRERYAQARQIKIREVSAGNVLVPLLYPNKLELQVSNLSDRQIFDVWAVVARQSLLNDFGFGVARSMDGLKSVESIRRATHDHYMGALDQSAVEPDGILLAGQSATLKFNAPLKIDTWVQINFTDANDARWRLQMRPDLGLALPFSRGSVRLIPGRRRAIRLMRTLRVTFTVAHPVKSTMYYLWQRPWLRLFTGWNRFKQRKLISHPQIPQDFLPADYFDEPREYDTGLEVYKDPFPAPLVGKEEASPS